MAINSWFRSFQIDSGIETLVKDLEKTIRISISYKISLFTGIIHHKDLFSRICVSNGEKLQPRLDLHIPGDTRSISSCSLAYSTNMLAQMGE